MDNNFAQTVQQMFGNTQPAGDQPPTTPTPTPSPSDFSQAVGQALPSPSSTGLPSQPQPGGSDWQSFSNLGQMVALEQNYPPDVLLAQAALESGHGTSKMAKEKNNYFGYEAYNANPNAAAEYKNPEESINAYINLIKTDPKYQWAYQQWMKDHNSKQLLFNIIRSGYAYDPRLSRDEKAQQYTTDAFSALGNQLGAQQ